MKIVLTGATGYIGKRLLPALLKDGHTVICCVRNRSRFRVEGAYNSDNVSTLEIDLLKEPAAYPELRDIDAAYYLVHSMSSNIAEFPQLEETSARNFLALVRGTAVKQIIYLGGIANEENLSKHLASRNNVEKILRGAGIPVTTLRAGIIVGSGSASFEIIRDLVEKLPVMIAPRWLNIRHHPIAIRNVIQYLTGVLLRPEFFGGSFDIGGPDILTYKEMLLQLAEVRGLRRYVWTVPVMTPRLSSYWLYFVTSTSYKLAVNLVDSMKIEVIAQPNELEQALNIRSIPYREAVARAFTRIEQNEVVSSWKDSIVSSADDDRLLENVNVPTFGCLTDRREKEIATDVDEVLNRIWSIGGERGWYHADWLWRMRGFLDKLHGGVGLGRGRTNQSQVFVGDTIDFWRVLVADRQARRLLLYAEMKLPGEAWLEFRIVQKGGKNVLQQTATFRPKGLLGRAYWYSIYPFHHYIFDGMARKIVA